MTNFQYSQLVWSTIINFYFWCTFDYNKIVGVVGIIVFGIMFIRIRRDKEKLIIGTNMKNIGFISVGYMGYGIAKNILKHKINFCYCK